MKSILILFILGIAAYEAVQYYEDRPPSQVIAVRQKAAITPTPEPSTEAPQPPDMALIPVTGEHPLTHARVKEVHDSGIVFFCDQGLVKVSFKKLPPQFQDYYQSRAVKDEIAPGPADVAPSPAPTPPPAARAKLERTPMQEAQAVLSYNQTCSGLRDRIRRDQDTIDHWYKQSSFVPDGFVSETQFSVAKADFEAATLQLDEVLANGP